MPPDEPGRATRDALLEAGRRVFGRRGYDGASIRAITREAGANLGAVTYHFGSKEGLYREVLEQALGTLLPRLKKAVAVDASGPERVKRVARAYVEHLAANPDLPHLLLQEIAAGKQPPPPVVDLLSRTARILVDMIQDGQARGELRRGDPIWLTLSLVSQPVYFALVRRAVTHLGADDPMGPDHLAALEEHVAAVAAAALAAPSETT